MPATRSTFTVASHFAKSAESVRATYAALLTAARTLGTVREDPKKTSIHLMRDTAFAGVATRKSALILTLKADRLLENPRIVRTEQTSANRWHVEIRLTSPNEIDDELRTWMAQAYEVAAAGKRS
jgi:hypothetical protein